MEINKLRSLIREAVTWNLKEIEEAAENAAMDAKLEAYNTAIENVNKKIETAESLEEMKELVDDAKLNELKKHLKLLEKNKAKLEKAKAKKDKGRKVVTDEPIDDTVDEGSYYNEDMNLGEENLSDEESEELRKKAEQNPSLALPEGTLNESFLKMQKLAGVITETQYNEAVDDIAMRYSNTAPNTPSGATPGVAPKKEDTNVKTIVTRLKPLVAQLKANDTTNEFVDLLKATIDLIQSVNKDALSDTEVVMGLNNLLIAKRKEMSAPKK